jgi:hypothetical protein
LCYIFHINPTYCLLALMASFGGGPATIDSSVISKGVPIGAVAASIKSLDICLLTSPIEPTTANGIADAAEATFPELIIACAALPLALEPEFAACLAA